MDICGEHGSEIAYMGRDCPACYQVDNLKEEHEKIVDEQAETIEKDYQRIRELEDELAELKEAKQ